MSCTGAPPLIPEVGIQPTPDQVADFTYSLTGSYSSPNYTYAFTVTNRTGEAIPGGFTLEFDLPGSAALQPPWGGSIESQQVNGAFTHYVLRMPLYVSLPDGGSFTLHGMIRLIFVGGFRNVQLNGFYSRQEFPDAVEPDDDPVLCGIEDIEIEVGSAFDPLAGVTVCDGTDGGQSYEITVSGTVNTDFAGIYELIYSATGSSNMTITATRRVSVVEPAVIMPVISGADDIDILIGSTFDPMGGVTASDAVDGDLTNEIMVSGSADTQTLGTYEITYQVTNSNYNTTTVIRTVTVCDSDTFYPIWTLGVVYVAGDCVNYQGQIYRAKWWTNSEVPGANQWGAWELIS